MRTMVFAVTVSSSWLYVGALALVGCGPKAQPAVLYAGDMAPGPSEAPFKHAAVVPVGYELMGLASTSCRFTADRRDIDDELLSDVDCGETRLRGALLRHAQRVGAEVVVGQRCYQRSLPASSKIAVSCRAGFARMSAAQRTQQPLSQRPAPTMGGIEADLDGVGDQAWKILLDYEPQVEARLQAARPGGAVHEYGTLPVNHSALGSISARCEGACALPTVRAALRVAAGRLGADAISDVGCHASSSGFSCVARIAQYTVAPGDSQQPAP